MEKENVADEFIIPRTESNFLKGADFDGEGKVLEIVKMEKFTPKLGADGKNYGATNVYGAGGVMIKENWFVKEGLLKEGESFKYIFKDGETEKSFDNSSLGFYFTFIKAELSAGDKVKIKRNKISETKVEWEIIKQ
jgi:hypothetical protein